MATYTVTVKDINGEETTVECADDELILDAVEEAGADAPYSCLLYTSPSPRDS